MTIVSMLLAGGQGSRLSILSQRRAKPAVPFGGAYRIIDFVLSNIMHSQIPYVGVLTQYKPYSLMDHIGSGEWWGFIGRDRMARVLPPYTGEEDSDWYAGTADAIWQNRNFIARFDPELVVVLSGDHIYKMDYRKMIDLHRARRADVTVALQEVPWDDTSRFGVVQVAEDGRVKAFQEKPKKDPISNLASLGIYVFDTDVLLRRLQEDAADPKSSKDFGKDVLPAMLAQDRMFGYVFDGYWRDVGTIQSLWEASMEALDPASGLQLSDWQVRTNYFDPQPGNDLPARIGPDARVSRSFVGRGCVVDGELERCVLFPGVRVGKGSRIRDSILMNNTVVGPDSVIEQAIIDKTCVVDRQCRVGIGDNTANSEYPHLLDTGITVIGKSAVLPPGTAVGKNVLVFPEVSPTDLPGSQLKDGATVIHRTSRKS